MIKVAKVNLDEYESEIFNTMVRQLSKQSILAIFRGNDPSVCIDFRNYETDEGELREVIRFDSILFNPIRIRLINWLRMVEHIKGNIQNEQ